MRIPAALLMSVVVACSPQNSKNTVQGLSTGEIADQKADKVIRTSSYFGQGSENNVAVMTSMLGLDDLSKKLQSPDDTVTVDMFRNQGSGYLAAMSLADWLSKGDTSFLKGATSDKKENYYNYSYTAKELTKRYEIPVDHINIKASGLRKNTAIKGAWNVNLYMTEHMSSSIDETVLAVMRKSPVLIFNGLQSRYWADDFLAREDGLLKKYFIVMNRCESENGLNSTEQYTLEAFAKKGIEVDLITIRTKVMIRTFNHTNAKFISRFVNDAKVSELVDALSFKTDSFETVPVWMSNKDMIASQQVAQAAAGLYLIGGAGSPLNGAVADAGGDVTVGEDLITVDDGDVVPPNQDVPPVTPPPGTPDDGGDNEDHLPPPIPDGDGDTPIVLDGNGDGRINGSQTTVWFDINGDGKKEPLSWIGASDWILAVDLNKNGKIDNGTELFGNHHVVAGKKAVNGFAALAAYDLNGDGVIDRNDAVYSQLLIWKDANGNGEADAGELQPFASQFASIAVHYQDIRKNPVYLSKGFGAFEAYVAKATDLAGKAVHAADVIFDRAMTLTGK